ncbi:MAG TPA: NAD(P)/FAD-dependent oxidoreductase [bacterium]|nr:NAD(P)/FAD-dependent oxidoreductase [bacterium]
MARQFSCDAIVVGSGPNGLAAGIVLARAGCSVVIYEAASQIGGGMRSAELTLPGFTHDICSTIHALGSASPFFRSVPLAQFGLEWITPPAPLAHPFDDGTAAVLERSTEQTGVTLGRDAAAYQKIMDPFVRDSNLLFEDILGPLRRPLHPFNLARFGFYGTRSAGSFASHFFKGEQARALFAGLSAHAIMPLEKPVTASFGLILGMLGHTAGWPVARGGSQCLANALASYFQSLGGKILTGSPVTSLEKLPSARAVLCDVTPRQFIRLAADRLPAGYRRALERYRYGPGVFKMDWALRAPIPWKAAECKRAGTVHLGGKIAEIAGAERDVWEGRHPSRPFVLVTQPTLFDGTRAPANRHTAWAYCHVPNGSTMDMSEPVESQIERFAPGFRDQILARSVMPPRLLEEHNANYIGGDINGGVQDLRQLFFRPALQWNPYATPVKGLYLCSSSTPPGGGVHGMCGYHAARTALHDVFGLKL